MKKIIALAVALMLVTTGTASAAVAWTTANSTATGDQDNAAVSAVRNGFTAVVWEDDRDTANPGDALHSDVWIRLFEDGLSRYEKKLSAGGTGNWTHVQPDVSLHDDGSAVVVWSEDPDGNGFYNIAVRVVRTDGTIAGSTTANTSSDGQQSVAAVAADPDSAGFAVVWEDKQSTTNATVRVAGFSSVTAKTYEAQVHANGGTHQRPDVAMGAAGNAIVVWDEDGDGNGFFNVARKALTPAGGVKLAQAAVNAAGGGQQRHASVAANFNGDFVVGWETDHTGALQTAVRSFSANGTAGSTVDTLVAGSDPQVGIDDQRAAVVTSVVASDVVTQGLNPDGSVEGRLPRQNTVQTATGRQDEAALGVDAWGLITVVYTDDNDGNGFDQVYLGTGWQNSTW
ncbi:hypothetical protein ABZ816_32060 [Actinosynnema sp. NPDC047251]|uniref:Secreted protein n=1 Tax=Saccharothrix espanaensis (strain ATCC 51144 / DSM 44229 / JCM 9112 / NBRC 15066 / NRRL 15764) TaxID=1179773 RepID=K0JZ83_SACES|nr:hypothetical protein [Saccharothrix espanaensis]CCH29984.1 hypothetical protein BN6_26710 [Saccharothrix espanaensis DSM 44229]